MTLLAHGIDIVQVSRIASMRAEHGDRFETRCFTERELAHGRESRRAGLDEYLAGRFASKEAILKALGTGWSGGILWTDVEVVPVADGPPRVELYGEALGRAQRLGVTRWMLSITHSGGVAVASAIALGA
ncbi:MAG: holo-ACP synthase [Planctomycetota bacterium]|jgi:holo-[acyl-carrier protein] synthase